MKRFIPVLLLLPFFASAQNADSVFIKKLANEILANGAAYENLRYLTKQIGGRLAGSPAMVKAENWGLQTLKASGADTAYMQQVMVPHWIRGGKETASVTQVDGAAQNRTLDVVALGNSMGSGKKGVSATVLAVADFAELERRKDEVKGKIVYYNYGFTPTNLRPGQSYGDAGKYRYNGASAAAKYGAVGVMIRSLSEATDNNPHTGTMSYNDSFPKIPAVALGLRDADYFWQLCKSHKTVKAAFTTHGYFLPDTIAHNVIAELAGTNPTPTYITVGGHLDSWDVNEGAHDDGAGIVQTIEILRALKALNYTPKNTIRFVLFADEESGVFGGEQYAADAQKQNEKHVFGLESDAGGFTPRGFSITLKAEQVKQLEPWINLLKPYGVYEFVVGGGGADVSPLNKTFNTPVAEFMPDNQRYFDVHHSRGDVLEAVNKRELLLGAINMAALIYLVDQHGLPQQ